MLGSRIAYSNPWLHVREDRVVRPDGKVGLYGVVVPQDNAATIALDDENRVALVSEYVYPLGRWSLQIPSGGIAAGETPLEGAIRELKEEAGLEAASWIPLGCFALTGGLSTQVSHLFVARGLRNTGAEREGTEHMELHFVPLADVLKLADDDQLIDAPTLVGIYRAVRTLGLA